jgi:hypothetical protein
MHPEQGGGVVASALHLHPSLVVDKRRTLGDEHGKRAERGILQHVALVVAVLAHVGQPAKADANPFYQDARCQRRQLRRLASYCRTLQYAPKCPSERNGLKFARRRSSLTPPLELHTAFATPLVS